MSLSRRLKDRFFSIQEDLSASVRGLASANVVEGASAVFDRVSTVTGVAAASAVGLGAGLGASPVYQKRTVNPESGSELLAYYQGQWEALHLEQEKNGRRARESDRIIAELHGRVAKQWRDTITLHSLLGQIPKINAQIQSIQMTLGELEPLFNNVEMSLMALEDTIDAHSLQERQQDRKQQLGLYEAQRRREFNELSEKLQRQHRSRREDVEAKEAVSKAQKQRIFQEKFENDVATFKTAPQETLKDLSKCQQILHSWEDDKMLNKRIPQFGALFFHRHNDGSDQRYKGKRRLFLGYKSSLQQYEPLETFHNA